MSILHPIADNPAHFAPERAQLRAQLELHLEAALGLADDLGMGFVGIDICQALERMGAGYAEAN